MLVCLLACLVGWLAGWLVAVLQPGWLAKKIENVALLNFRSRSSKRPQESKKLQEARKGSKRPEEAPKGYERSEAADRNISVDMILNMFETALYPYTHVFKVTCPYIHTYV